MGQGLSFLSIQKYRNQASFIRYTSAMRTEMRYPAYYEYVGWVAIAASAPLGFFWVKSSQDFGGLIFVGCAVLFFVLLGLDLVFTRRNSIITYDDVGLTYRDMFKREKRMPWVEIKSVRFEKWNRELKIKSDSVSISVSNVRSGFTDFTNVLRQRINTVLLPDLDAFLGRFQQTASPLGINTNPIYSGVEAVNEKESTAKGLVGLGFFQLVLGVGIVIFVIVNQSPVALFGLGVQFLISSVSYVLAGALLYRFNSRILAILVAACTVVNLVYALVSKAGIGSLFIYFAVAWLCGRSVYAIFLIHKKWPELIKRRSPYPSWFLFLFGLETLAIVIAGAVGFVAYKNSWSVPFPTSPGFHITAGVQPAESLAPLNAVRMPFTVVWLTNNTDKPVTVDGITVQASKMSAEEGIAEVELIDSTGLQIGKAASLDKDNRATIGEPFTVAPRETGIYTVAANIGDCDVACGDDGQKVSLSVIGIKTSSNTIGELPITGTEQTMNSHLKIGHVTANILDTGSSSTITSSTTDTTFAKLGFVSSISENVTLYSLRFAYTGTLDWQSLSNLKVNVGGTDYSATWDADGHYLTTAFLGGIGHDGAEQLSVYIHGNVSVADGAGKTVRFDIEDPADVYFVGQTFGYGISPEFINPKSQSPWYRGDTFTVGH